MSPASLVTRATKDPWTSSCHLLRRLAPSTSWVAFSRRRECGHRLRGVVADHFVNGAAELGHEHALSGEGRVVVLSEAVIDGDVYADEFAADAARHPCGAANRRLATDESGDADDDAFTGLPCLGDAVCVEVAGQRFFDAVGQPQQCELSQRSEVAGPEVIGERRVDTFRGIDVAVRHPASDRFG